MTLISVIALILSLTGDSAIIDKGMAEGLRPGDQGTVFYTLKVGQQVRRIEVATAEVVSAEDFTSRVRLLDRTATVRKYSIDFQIPEDRVTPDFLLRLTRARLSENQPEVALKYLDRLNGNQSLTATIKALKAEAERQIAANREVPRPAPPAQRAESTIAQKAAVTEPESRTAMASFRAIDEERKHRGMALMEAAPYQIGLNAEAQYYNQRPRFEIKLKEFWIDRRPTEKMDLTHAEAQAYCAALGKRLPTELEWEAAAAANAIVGAPRVEEWTSSWYQPYPGNSMREPEYGEKFRVIRGFPAIQRRRFIDPNQRVKDITFRCACE